MIRVDMTRDVRRYDPKVFNGWTANQAAHMMIGMGVLAAIAYFIPVQLDSIPGTIMVKLIIGTIFAFPFFLGANFNEAGLTYEQFLARWIYRKFIAKKYRVQFSGNPYYELYEQYKKEQKQKKFNEGLKAKSEAERKQAVKQHEKHRIQYSTKAVRKMYR